MPIITPPNANVPLTHEALLANFVAMIKTQIDAQFHQNITVFNNTWKEIYNNPKFTPAEIFTALGSDATQLLIISQAFGTAINAVIPNTVSLVPPVTLTPNADGAVSVTPKTN